MLVSNRVAGVIAFLGLSVGTAYGADLSSGPAASYKDAPGSYWVVTVGGYGVYEPAYPGAKDSIFSGRPIIDVHQAGAREWLALPNDAFSLTLYQTDNFRARRGWRLSEPPRPGRRFVGAQGHAQHQLHAGGPARSRNIIPRRS